MKSKIIKFFVVAGFLTATVTSCYKDDFDELQKQVDELEEKVAQNAKDIQEQITNIESTIAALQQQDADFGQELQGLVSDLQQVSDEVEANAKSVYYGNLVTDEDYAALKMPELMLLRDMLLFQMQNKHRLFLTVDGSGKILF